MSLYFKIELILMVLGVGPPRSRAEDHDALPLYHAGQILFFKGQHQEAARYLEKAIRCTMAHRQAIQISFEKGEGAAALGMM